MKGLTRAINNQLATEFQASHAYLGNVDLAMSIWLREKGLVGFSFYMLTKINDERGRASRMVVYLVDSDQAVELHAIDAPQRDWSSVQALFDDVYDL